MEAEGLTDALVLAEGLTDADGLTDALGEREALGDMEAEGLTDALGDTLAEPAAVVSSSTPTSLWSVNAPLAYV